MKNARDQFVAVMGAWMGAAGIEHGIGEFLQGDIAPKGIMIQSWPGSAFFASLSGEPAMTILPNLRATGILAIIISLLYAAWAVFFARRKHGGLILMLLTIPMLLFGGGIFPPILGLLIGVAAARFQAPAGTGYVTGFRQQLGQAWRWVFPACCLAWLALFPGIAAMHFFLGINSVAITLAVMLSAFLLLFLSYVSSIQHDRLESSTL